MGSTAGAAAATMLCFPEPAAVPGSRIGALVTRVAPLALLAPFVGLSSVDGPLALDVFAALGEATPPSGPLRCSMKPITIAASRATAAKPIQIVFEDAARE